MKELFNYEIFRLNYMNMVSNRAQMLHNRLWAVSGNNLEARIAHFILSHVERPSGKKVLKIKMEDLAQIVNETRAGSIKSSQQHAGQRIDRTAPRRNRNTRCRNI